MRTLLKRNRLKTKPWMPSIGTYATGEPLHVDPLDLKHWLITGSTGGGKSSYVNALLNVLQHSDYRFYGIDCKQGLELLPWNHLFDEVACDPTEATNTIEQVNTICTQRLKKLKANCLRKWPDNDRIVLIIDELAECLTFDHSLPLKEAKTELTQRQAGLVSLARLGRAAGVYVIAASQTGYVESVPPALKANCAVRIACKLPTIELLKSALGSTYGFQPEDIPPYPGAALCLGLPDSPTHPRLARAYWVET